MQFSIIAEWLVDGASPNTGKPVLETRRIVKPEHKFYSLGAVEGWFKKEQYVCSEKPPYIIYELGKTYAIQLGRGKKGIGRTQKLASIERQDVREMTLQQAIDSGFASVYAYLAEWVKMHDPQVLILEAVPNAWLGGLKKDWKRGVCWGENEYMLKELKQRPAERYDAWILRFEAPTTELVKA